jgi:hypothetical protein
VLGTAEVGQAGQEDRVVSEPTDTPYLLADSAYDWQRALDMTNRRIEQLVDDLETEQHIRALILAHTEEYKVRLGKAERYDAQYGQRGPE